MAGAGFVPQAIVLALGAGALGGPDALRLLLQFPSRGPAVDLVICVVVISLATVPLLGTMLLARFVRKARAGGVGGPLATDRFAQMTATVSVGVASLVTACLLVVPGGLGAVRLPIDFAVENAVVVISLATDPLLGTMLLALFVRKARAGGGPPATDRFAQMTATVSVGAASLVTACLLVMPGGQGAVRLPIDFTVKNAIVVTVLALCAAAVGVGSLPCAMPLHRSFRGAGSVGGPAPAALVTTIKIVFLVAVSLVASGGFHWWRRMVTMPVGIAIVMVAGTTLLVRCSRRARNAAGGGGGAAARTS